MRHRFRIDVLAACIAGIGLGSLDGATAVAAPGDPIPPATSDAGRQIVVDDPSITGDRPLRVDAWHLTEAADELSVQFPLTSPDCTGVHAVVSETDQLVTVALHAGTRSAAIGRMCTMIVVPAALHVELQSPLGDRTVVSAF